VGAPAGAPPAGAPAAATLGDIGLLGGAPKPLSIQATAATVPFDPRTATLAQAAAEFASPPATALVPPPALALPPPTPLPSPQPPAPPQRVRFRERLGFVRAQPGEAGGGEGGEGGGAEGGAAPRRGRRARLRAALPAFLPFSSRRGAQSARDEDDDKDGEVSSGAAYGGLASAIVGGAPAGGAAAPPSPPGGARAASLPRSPLRVLAAHFVTPTGAAVERGGGRGRGGGGGGYTPASRVRSVPRALPAFLAAAPNPPALRVRRALILKTHDDVRQDALVEQVATLLRAALERESGGGGSAGASAGGPGAASAASAAAPSAAAAGLLGALRPYAVLPARVGGAPGGIIECIPDVRSRDEIGKAGFRSLRDWFRARFGPPASAPGEAARLAFTRSLAASSLLC
jgi:hypothetical protein